MADVVVVDPENKNPKELLGQGIKAYILQDYNVAVSALSQASELLALEHGDDEHESLGEVYLYYGKALLGLARDETDALGDAVPKNESSDDDDDDVGQAKDQENGEKENDKDKDKEKLVDTNLETKQPQEEAAAEVSAADAEEDDEASDLQVAWEVLELAKRIFTSKQDSGRKQLAETLITLGEVSQESENFEAACQDIKQGVELQKQLFGSDSRTLAESLYKLGVAYSTTSQIEEAIHSFGESLQYLNNRINVLEKEEDKKDSIREEITEIKGLIPEIEEKIADMKSYKEEAIKNLAVALNEPTSSSSSTSQASDISHLVKRKRKPEEVEKNGSTPSKKPSL